MVRVFFRDDDGRKGFYFSKKNTRKLGQINLIMKHGLRFFGFHFCFFSYSNSQIKSHGGYFFDVRGAGITWAELESRAFTQRLDEVDQSIILNKQTPLSK